jgi:hypothetical protein
VENSNKQIEVTKDNAPLLAVKLLDITVSQNREIIDRLGVIAGLLGKLPAVDVSGKSDE